MKINLKILLLVVVLIVGLIINLLGKDQLDVNVVTNSVEIELNNQVEQINKLVEETDFELLLEDSLQLAYLKELSKASFQTYVFKNNQLMLWSSNEFIPENLASLKERKLQLLKSKKGFHLAYLRTINSSLSAVFRIPLKYEYPINNKYLQNHYNRQFKIPETFHVADPTEKFGVPINDANGNTIFKLVYDETNLVDPATISEVIGGILVLTCVLILMIFGVNNLINKHQILGFVAYLLCFFLFKQLFILVPFEFKSSEFDLFSPLLYASNIFGESLGEFIINGLLILWGALLLYFKADWSSSDKPLASVIVSFLIAFLTVIFVLATKSLVVNSVISFELSKFTTIDINTIIGVAGVFLFLLPILILNYRQNELLGKLNRFNVILLVIYALFVGLFLWMVVNLEIAIIMALWYLLFSLLSNYIYQRNVSKLSFSKLVFYLAFFALVTAIILEHFNLEKETAKLELLADNLSKERDEMAEFSYHEISERIKNDLFIANYYTNPMVSLNELTQRINYIYLTGYLSNYNLSVHPFNLDGKLVKSNDSIEFNQFIEQIETGGVPTQTDKFGNPVKTLQLYFIPLKNLLHKYIAVIEISSDNGKLGNLVLEFLPKVYSSDNIYPELLVEEKIQPIYQENEEVSYAIYSDDKLVNFNGDYNYPFISIFDSISPYRYLNNYLHFSKNTESGKTVVVSKKDENLIIPLSIFSYLFCIYLVFLLSILLVYFLWNRLVLKQATQPLSLNFRNRVNYSMIFIIVASFVIIGIVTVRYFSIEYDNYHKQRLIRKQRSVLSALEYEIKDRQFKDLSRHDFNLLVAELSDIHNLDVNLYNTAGYLNASSQPAIFNKGLQSKYINPFAYHSLKTEQSEQVLQTERIGLLSYLAIYVPVRNNMGQTIGFLNLPYFAKEKNLKQEISDFMVALVNVYVFLLICAGLVAYFISNSVTRPLTEIGEKLRLVNLTSKNEPIEWKTNDEIGALVKEYNRMINQLEESAQLMAKTERELAWRQMARQIAHEIKNPLTPMKLNIQYLRRAVNEDPNKGQEMINRISKSMVEQIDNLAAIATAFSSFAQMPKAVKERVDLVSVLETVVNLFEEESSVNLVLNASFDSAYVWADKNQLISAFNNLVKNAIQACSETKDAKVTVELKFYENNKYRVNVTDNGSGIPEDMREKVFVPNFTTKSSGTGLGLAITRQIIELSEGSIGFNSVTGKGTTFYVILKQYHE